jgi:hypothetical protein
VSVHRVHEYVYQFLAEQNGMTATSLFALSDPKVPSARLTTLLQSSANQTGGRTPI